ncbi:Glycosyltransferase involved in cell wall bisynthesis [Frankineae bacterium MT45]|nr:Glycosyltransferase involved in cell wall bisynthesis [Frankineae bacterium MT45]
MREVQFVVAEGIDDPARPSGGNSYNRRVRDGLLAAGWGLRVDEVAGAWPAADPAAHARLNSLLSAAPDGATLLIDGLIASSVPEILATHTRRLRLVVLLHMPLGLITGNEDGRRAEEAALSAAAAIVTTSGWSRDRLLELYPLDPTRISVARPGVEAAPLAAGSESGQELLCVGALAEHKGQDLLLAALAELPDLSWRCRFVGPTDRDPAYVAHLIARSAESGLADRVSFAGPRSGAELAGSYAEADVLILPSRFESYGMVITEALARGIPVIAAAVGGVPEALMPARDERRPGLLLPPEDPAALAEALRRWLSEPPLRRSLRALAREVRPELSGWEETTARLALVLDGIGRQGELVSAPGRISLRRG